MCTFFSNHCSPTTEVRGYNRVVDSFWGVGGGGGGGGESMYVPSFLFFLPSSVYSIACSIIGGGGGGGGLEWGGCKAHKLYFTAI